MFSTWRGEEAARLSDPKLKWCTRNRTEERRSGGSISIFLPRAMKFSTEIVLKLPSSSAVEVGICCNYLSFVSLKR